VKSGEGQRRKNLCKKGDEDEKRKEAQKTPK
jgi:hypothetical protein